jgi:predicted ATPase
MIKRIWIEHYKSLSRINLGLEDVSVLVGSNSTGKSNFIDAIAFLRDCAVHGLDHAVSERHGIDSIIQWSPTRPYNLDLTARYETHYGKGYYSLKLSSKARQPVILEEFGGWKPTDQEFESRFVRTKSKIYFDSVDPKKKADELKRYARRLQEDELFVTALRLLPPGSGTPFRHLHRAISDFRIYNIYPNTIRSPQKSSNEHELNGSGENLDSVLKQMVSSKSLSSKAKYQEILSSMAKIIPNLEQSLSGHPVALPAPNQHISR